MFAPSGLDAGLLVGAEHVVAWSQGFALPAPLVKIEDAASFASKVGIARENPTAMTPGPQRILAEPAPNGGAADLRDDAARHCLLA
jgi:hypothetical protein